MENYTLIALLIIGSWLIGFIVYMVISNRQVDIEGEIDQVNTMLDAGEAGRAAE